VKVRFTFILIILTALFAGNAFSQKIDTLVFDNGNVVTGELKWLELGIADYKTDAAGTIQIKWERVKFFKSHRMFDIRTESGARYFGSFQFGSEDYTVKIVLLNDFIELPIAQVVDIHVLNRNFWMRLDGSIDLGFQYTKASDVMQFNLRGQVEYYGERWSSNLDLNSIITTQTGKSQTRKQDLLYTLRRFLKNNWNIYGITGVEQNTELGLDLRALLSLGTQKEMFRTRRNYLFGIGGLSVNQEWSNNYETRTSNLEVMAGVSFQKYKHITPKIDFSSFVLVYPSLTSWGRVRLNFEAKGRFEIISDLFVSITFYDNFDNQPATDGAAKNDWGVILSIGYSW
jgi:hypothetical protein